MQIFLSYANERRAVADSLALALRERGHEVFLDRDDLKPGEGYGANIEDAIKQSDLMVFLISPESVQPGRYTLSELEFARKHWRTANRKLVPVMIAPTDMSLVPSFAKSVNVLQPKGDVVAEAAAAVDEQRGIEYAVTVGLKVSGIALAFGLLSWFCFQDSGEAIRRTPSLPLIGEIPAPEVGLLFSIPVGVAVWQWGLRRWWAFLIPLVIVTVCYWAIAPSISELTLKHSLHMKDGETFLNFQKITTKFAGQLDAAEMKFLEGIRNDVIEYHTNVRRILLGLISGAVMAFGTMISLGLVMPQFRSVFRWLVVLSIGAIISGIDAAIVLQGGGLTFSGFKAMMLILVWQGLFGALLGFWLARGRTTISG